MFGCAVDIDVVAVTVVVVVLLLVLILMFGLRAEGMIVVWWYFVSFL